jgi:hypothetical protein
MIRPGMFVDVEEVMGGAPGHREGSRCINGARVMSVFGDLIVVRDNEDPHGDYLVFLKNSIIRKHVVGPILSVGGYPACKDHSNYTGTKPPRVDCKECERVYWAQTDIYGEE